jgi:hypothetical protein
MSLNESKTPTRSNLTKDQQRREMAAIYGRNEEIIMSDKEKTFIPAEIAKMKEIIAQQKPERPREFDLNHPELTAGIIPPYRHQEYPVMMYRDGSAKAANDAEEENKAIEAGWGRDPMTNSPKPNPESEEGEEIQRPKRGRPPKNEEGS